MQNSEKEVEGNRFSILSVEDTEDEIDESNTYSNQPVQRSGACISQSINKDGSENSSDYGGDNEDNGNGNPQKTRSTIIIIGDSIAKHIDPKKLSRRPVQKFTYPGKTCEALSEVIGNTNAKPDSSHVIIHSGTNNLVIDSPELGANKVKNLAVKVKRKLPNSKIGVSGLTYREDVIVDS